MSCWGANCDGQVGDGSTTDRTNPVSVSGITNGALAVGSGLYHTCAVTTGGAVAVLGKRRQRPTGGQNDISVLSIDTRAGRRPGERPCGRHRQRDPHLRADESRKHPALGGQRVRSTGGRDHGQPIGADMSDRTWQRRGGNQHWRVADVRADAPRDRRIRLNGRVARSRSHAHQDRSLDGVTLADQRRICRAGPGAAHLRRPDQRPPTSDSHYGGADCRNCGPRSWRYGELRNAGEALWPGRVAIRGAAHQRRRKAAPCVQQGRRR